MSDQVFDSQRKTEKIWRKCRCGFEIKENDPFRFDNLCPRCGLDWLMYGFDGNKGSGIRPGDVCVKCRKFRDPDGECMFFGVPLGCRHGGPTR